MKIFTLGWWTNYGLFEKLEEREKKQLLNGAKNVKISSSLVNENTRSVEKFENKENYFLNNLKFFSEKLQFIASRVRIIFFFGNALNVYFQK